MRPGLNAVPGAATKPKMPHMATVVADRFAIDKVKVQSSRPLWGAS